MNASDADHKGRHRIGVVVIGRNEGERLRLCLESVLGNTVVYVDSGSTDGSIALARSMGVVVVELDTAVPFSAARARNEGFARLQEGTTRPTIVQFVDGDCEVAENWLACAAARLLERSDLAIVCGRLRERFPDASIYNRLCDMEWDTPVGEARACGGIFMIKANAFEQVGGFDSTLIAGEEPELCLRLRRAGWAIERIDAEMALHDAAIHKFSQWWRRAVRSGHAYAEGFMRYGFGPERYNARPLASILFWAMALPVAGLSLMFVAPWWSLVVLGLYSLQWLRLALSLGPAYATFLLCGKFAQLVGAAGFLIARMTGRRRRIIEYKSPENPGTRAEGAS